VVTNADADTVSVLLGKADATFAADVRRTDYAFGSYIRSGALGDLNGDGKTDLWQREPTGRTGSQGVATSRPGGCRIQT
jgi:hypothetical protein